MKISTLKPLLLLALSACAAVFSQAANAATHLNGDIFLGVHASGGAGSNKNYMIDIGQASTFESGNSVLTVVDVGADLSFLFGGPGSSGGPWYTRSDVSWGITGTTGATAVGSDPAKTLFASRQQVPAGTQSTPWTRQSNTTQGGITSAEVSLGTAYDNAPSTGLVAPKAVVQANPSANNWASYQPGGSNSDSGSSFSFFNGGIEATFDPGTGTSGTATSILDFYRTKPATNFNETDTPGDYLGFFYLNDSGVLKFVPASLVGTSNVAFSSSTYSVAENLGTIDVTINRDGDPTVAGAVDVSTVDGTAVHGTDFTAITNQTVNFAIGETQKTVTVTVNNLHGASGDRSFKLHFSNATTGITAGADTTVTITAQITASVIQLTSATYSAIQTDSFVTISLTRTGGTHAETAKLTTTNGTATSGTDYTGVTSTSVAFGTGVNTATLNIALTSPTGGAKTFTVAIDTPGGSDHFTVGNPGTATVTIRPPDSSPPTVSVSSPASGATITGSGVTISGSAKDVGDTASTTTLKNIKVTLNGTVNTVALGTTGVLGTSWTFSPGLAQGLRGGLNSVQVTAYDLADNASNTVSFNFTLVKKGPLNIVTKVGPSVSSTGGKVNGLVAGATAYQVGNSYTLTAVPSSTSFVFDHWEIPVAMTGTDANGADASGVNKTKRNASLSFVYTDILQGSPSITAVFISNPFATAKIGAFNGLILDAGTTPGNDTTGFITVTVTNTGSFTGTMKIDGLSLPIKGQFDTSGVARFGATATDSVLVPRVVRPALELKLNLDLAGSSAQITGTVKQYLRSTVVATSNVTADRANFSATIPVAANYLVNKGSYTVVLPAKAQSNGLTVDDFPQGTGFGTITVVAGGTVTFAGTLADGTAVTASAPLSKTLTVPLYQQLYTGSAGCFAAQVKLDDTQTDSDLKGTNCLWFRPWMDNQYYQFGWDEGVSVDLIGAKYNSGLAPVIPGLSGSSNNTLLSFFNAHDSTLNASKLANISSTNVVTKSTTDYTFILTSATGKFTGTFPAAEGNKPAFQGIVIQKGPYSGGNGYFLTVSPTVKDYTGTSGKMTVRGNVN